MKGLVAYCLLCASVAALYAYPERWLLVPCAVVWFGVWVGTPTWGRGES